MPRQEESFIDFKVENADDLARALKKMRDKGIENEMRKAGRLAATLMRDAVRPEAPESDKPRTRKIRGERVVYRPGALRKSVKAKASRTAASVVVGDPRKSKKRAPVFYAAWVNYGHRLRGGGVFTGTRWVNRAVKANAERVRKVYDQRLDYLVKRFNRKWG